tara:strand:- start:1365 stop:1808 length:444 start_codon:yes stop_codon:yes gene_type:complete
MTQNEIINDNLEEYNNYITQKNKIKEEFKIAKKLILDYAKNTDNLLDIWEQEVSNQTINDNYNNINKIIYYENNSDNNLGIHFNNDVAKYFIDNYRLNIKSESFLFSLYPNPLQSIQPYQIVIITQKYIYITNNNPNSKTIFNIIEL